MSIMIWIVIGCRYSFTKAFCIAFMMTFFSVFDVPVFWPILLCYWVVLFVLTMRRQIAHMIKYKYIPFNIGKQVTLRLNWLSSFYFLPLQFVLYILSGSSNIYLICIIDLNDSNLFCFNVLQKYTGKRSSPSSSGSRADWSLVLLQLEKCKSHS